MKRAVAFTLGQSHPSARMRVTAYIDYFRKHDWLLEIHAFDAGMGKAKPRTLANRIGRWWKSNQAAARLRAFGPKEPIIISRELPSGIRPFLQAPNPMILDVDDALYLEPGRDRLFRLCRHARVVVCGNPIIADNLSAHARRTVVIPTMVNPDLYEVRADHELNSPLRLGWLGSSMSFDQTLWPWLPVLQEIRTRVPFELTVILDEYPPALRDKAWVKFLNWSPEIEPLLSRHMDAGIMPLEDNEYQRAKCGAKLLQYMAAGLPTIATSIGVNRELVIDGVTGFWAANREEWEKAIKTLAADKAKRQHLGRAGREQVVKNYCIAHWGEKWISLLDEISR